MNSDPVLLFYGTESCPHCVKLAQIWGEVATGPHTVKKLVNKAFPNVRVQNIIIKSNMDESKYPAGLKQFVRWVPMIMLIPGRLWDQAMSNLNSVPPVSLIEGTQVMNAIWKNGSLERVNEFDQTKADSIVAWVKRALADPNFIKVQSGTPEPNTNLTPHLRTLPARENPFKSTDNVCTIKIITRPK